MFTICINWEDPLNLSVDGAVRISFESADFEYLMDVVRKEKGLKPFFTTGDYDPDGWYDFDLYITESGIVNNEVLASVENHSDDDCFYAIPLTQRMATELFEDIKTSLTRHGHSISELLKEG